MAICRHILDGQTFPEDEITTPQISVYLYLRDQLQEYKTAGTRPSLGLLKSPDGGIQRIREQLARHDIDLAEVESAIEDEEDHEDNAWFTTEFGVEEDNEVIDP